MAMLRKARARVPVSVAPATATPATPEECVAETPAAATATAATPEDQGTVRDRRDSSSGQGVPGNTKTYPALTEQTKARLKQVVFRLTRDCVDWYRDDQEILNDMSEEDLEAMVLHYLSLRDFYRRRG